MRFKSILLAFFLLIPAFVHSYPKAFDAILPADAVEEKELTKLHADKMDAARQKMLGKFYTRKTLYHLFTTRLSFKEAQKVLGGRGIVLKPLKKAETLAEIEKKKPIKKRNITKLLQDPKFESAHGTYQNWLVTLVSYTYINKQKVDRTTIIFTKAVEVKKEEAKGKETKKP